MKTIICILLSIGIYQYSKAQTYPSIREVFDFNTGDEFHYAWTESGPPQGYKVIILSKTLSANLDTLTYVREKTSYSFYYFTEPFNHSRVLFNTVQDTIYYTQLDSGIHIYYEVKESDSIHQVTDTSYISPEFWGLLTYFYELIIYPGFEPIINTAYHIKGFGNVKWGHFHASSNRNIAYKLIYARKQGIDYGTPDQIYLKNSLANTDDAIRFHHYPNPVDKQLYLTDIPESTRGMTIRSVDGKLYRTFKQNEWLEPLDVSFLPAGVYFIEIISEKPSFIKVIKN